MVNLFRLNFNIAKLKNPNSTRFGGLLKIVKMKDVCVCVETPYRFTKSDKLVRMVM